MYVFSESARRWHGTVGGEGGPLARWPAIPDVFRKATLVVRKAPDDDLGVPDTVRSVPDGNLRLPGGIGSLPDDIRNVPDAVRKITSPECLVNTGLARILRTASGKLRATSVRFRMTF